MIRTPILVVLVLVLVASALSQGVLELCVRNDGGTVFKLTWEECFCCLAAQSSKSAHPVRSNCGQEESRDCTYATGPTNEEFGCIVFGKCGQCECHPFISELATPPDRSKQLGCERGDFATPNLNQCFVRISRERHEKMPSGPVGQRLPIHITCTVLRC